MSTREMQIAVQRRMAQAILKTSSVTAAESERTRTSAEQQVATLQLALADVYRELYEAAQIQRQLSGPRLLNRGDFEVAAEIFPVRHLSGDFFNISEIDTTALLAIGDIGGKGVMAAMWFTHLLGLTRMHGTVADPARAIAEVNRELCVASSQPPLTSMFLGRLDWLTGELTYCNAGHPAPVVLRGNGENESLNAGGLVLGVVPDAPFSAGRAVLGPGDTLLGFSDGLLECCNERDEQFGVERVIAEARRAMVNGDTSSILFSIVGAAQDFAGALSRTDDCSMIVVRRRSALARLASCD